MSTCPELPPAGCRPRTSAVAWLGYTLYPYQLHVQAPSPGLLLADTGCGIPGKYSRVLCLQDTPYTLYPFALRSMHQLFVFIGWKLGRG